MHLYAGPCTRMCAYIRSSTFLQMHSYGLTPPSSASGLQQTLAHGSSECSLSKNEAATFRESICVG